MTTVIPMPPEILAKVIYEQLCIEELSACLRLRLVNKYFDQEVLRTFIDSGIFDRRFRRKLIHYAVVHDHFALHYLKAFVKNARKEASKLRHHKTRRRRHHIITTDSTSSNSNESDDSMLSLHALGPSKRGRRVRWSQHLLTSAIVLLVSNSVSQQNLSPGVGTSDMVSTSTEEEAWTTWTDFLCNAMVTLLGARGSILFVGPNTLFARTIYGAERHLSGKSAEFYALIAAAYSGNFSLACKWLEQFRIDHRREQRWLRRLDSDWDNFAWNSNKREKVWLEVLAACLTIAVKRQDSPLFLYIVDLEPGIFTPAFTRIHFSERKIIEEVITTQRLDYLQTLADRGWCLTRTIGNDVGTQRQYEAALIAALNLSSNLPQRLEMLRILLIVSQDWQRSNNFRRLLLHAAEDNDTKLATLMLNLLSETPIKWAVQEAANFEITSRFAEGRDALDVAEMNGSLEMVHFLLRHRRQMISIVPESWSYINPKRAIKQIVHRGEPSHMDCFKDIVFAARDAHLGLQFTEAAAKLSTETLAILAQYVDLDATKEDYDIIIIDEDINSLRGGSVNSPVTGNSSLPRTRSRTSRTSASSSDFYVGNNTADVDNSASGPTIGETALANALKALNWKNARFLIEDLGVKLSWGSIKGIDVLETDESNMEALVELRELLAKHGMFMETRLIYVPFFHPGQAASTTKPRLHEIEVAQDVDRNTRSSNSRRSSEVATTVSF